MRPSVLLVFVCLACGAPVRPSTPGLQGVIDDAADREGVPRALLTALAWTDSRLSMEEGPRETGVLQLSFDETSPRALRAASRLTGLGEDALRTDLAANLRGGAALLRAEMERQLRAYPDLREDRLGDWYQAVMTLSGSLDARVADAYAAQAYRVLRDGLSVVAPDGSLVQLAPQELHLEGRAIWGELSQDLSGEYCPNGACVAFVPASTSNYASGRGGAAITQIVIHDMEGGYAGSISWFQNASAQASAHYCIRSSDGEITQMVSNADTAWHAGNHDTNVHSIGIEHEGYAHTGATWYTEAMYRSSAALVRWLADRYGIAKDRAHIIGHYEVPDPNHAGWYGGASNHHDPCDSWAGNPTWHNVSACYWDWDHYLALITGAAQNGTLTGFVGDACCGITAGTRKPLAGATVVLAGTSFTTKTDSTGTYTFTLPAGTYTPQASLAGYATGDHSSLGAGYAAQLAVTANGTSWGSILLHTSTPAPVKPVVTITSPKDGAVAAQSPLSVTGTVSDAAVTSVKVNGADVACAAGAFSAPVSLVAGQNTITVAATNAAGTGSATVHVSYAPPSTGVAGTVTGTNGAKVANAAVTLQPGGAHTVTGSDGRYVLTAAPGEYTLAVDAAGYDPASRTATVPASAVVTVDVALSAAVEVHPHIRIDQPADGQLFTEPTVVVTGVVEVPHLASASLGEEAISVDTTGAFSAQVSLQQGSNALTVTATDTSGRTVSASVTVEYAPQALDARGGCTSAPAGLQALAALLVLLHRRRRAT